MIGSLQSDGFGKMHKEAILMYSNAVKHSGLCNIQKILHFTLTVYYCVSYILRRSKINLFVL